RRIALQQLLLGEHGIVVAAVGERADHGAARAVARALYEPAELILARHQHLATRREIVAVVERIAAWIDKDRARAVAQSAAAQRHHGTARQCAAPSAVPAMRDRGRW